MKTQNLKYISEAEGQWLTGESCSCSGWLSTDWLLAGVRGLVRNVNIYCKKIMCFSCDLTAFNFHRDFFWEGKYCKLKTAGSKISWRNRDTFRWDTVDISAVFNSTQLSKLHSIQSNCSGLEAEISKSGLIKWELSVWRDNWRQNGKTRFNHTLELDWEVYSVDVVKGLQICSILHCFKAIYHE